MKYINQLEYAHIPYYTKVKIPEFAPTGMKSSVRGSGCGPCSVCMAVEYLTDTTLDIEECIRISESCLANHSRGTDMNVLGPVIAEKFGLVYSKTSDLDEAINHMRNGGVIVAHVGVPEGKEIGLFTKGGHYILLLSTDGKEFCILDPSYKEDKFTIPERAGRVNDKNAPYLYASVETVHSEAISGKVKYHLFKRSKK